MKKKILFVDDEPKILDGIRRMLRGMRKEWDMSFANGGEPALEMLAEQPADVIVSDMRMPGMDGAALLNKVQEQYPGTVRIVLSGHTEMEQSIKAVNVAHQFLSKPCESDSLREVVNRAIALREVLTTEPLKDAVGQIDSLPAVPRVYTELCAALADPEVDLEHVAAIVEQDTGLTAKLLQLVNSTLFGVAREVTSIRQATTFLGTQLIKNLTLSMAVFQDFLEGERPKGFSLDKEQTHAMVTAGIARKIVDDRVKADEAFLASMLHDIGKLVMVAKLRSFYDQAADAAEAQGKLFCEVDREAIGISHADIGSYLLGIWGLPDPIVEAVAHHHDPAAVSHSTFDVLDAVHVADAIAHELALEEPDLNGPLPIPVNLEHLEAIGVLGELPGWRKMAQEELGGASDQAA